MMWFTSGCDAMYDRCTMAETTEWGKIIVGGIVTMAAFVYFIRIINANRNIT
jgi:hypothetical protein